MQDIVPALLEKDFREIKNKLSALRSRVRCVQIDICDGIFVPNSTWPFASGGFEDFDFQKIINEEEGMPFWQEFDFELDLMVRDALENFDIYLKLGPKRVIFHLEAVGDVIEFKEFLEGLDPYSRDNVEIGVAISPKTPLEKIFPLLSVLDFVQVMGIEQVGFQGHPFSDKSLEYIRALREKFPDLLISVDGAVSLETAPKILVAGAKRLAVGSALWKAGDVLGTLETFQNLV